MAAKILPTHLRERYAEEWQSYINDRPGIVSKFFAVLGLFVAAETTLREETVLRWRAEARESQRFYAELQAFVDEYMADPLSPLTESLKQDAKNFNEAMEKIGCGKLLVDAVDNVRINFLEHIFYRRKISQVQKDLDKLKPRRTIVLNTIHEIREDKIRLREQLEKRQA